MKRMVLPVALLVLVALPNAAQGQEIKFIADTITVQADGQFEADPDLATLSFHIASQEKELKRAYDVAAKSMQKIVALAERNGLRKEEISTGALTVVPFYEGDRKKRARSFLVSADVVLRVKDFSRIGELIDGSIQDEIADFRALTYSLADEEAAKERAVAQAMSRAVGRATVALEQKGQKLGTLRYASVDVKQVAGVARLYSVDGLQMSDAAAFAAKGKELATPSAAGYPTTTQPEKIRVTASVQCAFQIQ